MCTAIETRFAALFKKKKKKEIHEYMKFKKCCCHAQLNFLELLS